MALTGWDATKKIALTIDAADISADLADFPVLINLGVAVGKTGYDASAIFTELGASSLKIAVEIGDTDVQCYCEIEFWDSANNKAVLHVKVPSILAASGAVLNLYYDSLQADNTTYIGNTGDAAAQSVWDANFVAVYHMAQDPSGTAPQILDSTSNVNHGTSYGTMTSADLVDGLVGKAINFDGVDDYIDIGTLIDPVDITIEGLFSTTTLSANAYIGILSDSYTTGGYIEGCLSLRGDLSYELFGGFYTGSWYTGLLSSGLNDGLTHHVSAAYNSTAGELSVDGSFGTFTTGTAILTEATPWRIAARWDAATEGGYFEGIIECIRISNITRSADWISTTNLTLRDTLLTLSLPAGGTVTVLNSLIQLYDLPPYIVAQYIKQLYSLAFSLNVPLDQVYGLRMLAAMLQPYGNSPTLTKRLIQYYGDSTLLCRALEQLYDDALQINKSLEQLYIFPEALQRILEQKYSISSTELQAISDQLYAIKSVDQAMAILEQPFAVIDGRGRLLSYDISVECGGQAIDVTGINIEAGQDSFCISCEIALASQSDYVSCSVLDDLVVTVPGETFNLFIESRQRNRGHATAEYTINGLSKTARLDAPYAEPITDDLSGLASAIVTTLAAGYTVNWQTVDWYIPANTLMPADQSPLNVIRQIVAAAGAIIQTEPDGTMTIEPAYPVAVPDWSTATIDTSLSDGDDFFTTGEDFDHRPGYNRFLISDQLTSDNTLRLVEEQVSDNQKYILAYQTPWADDFTLDHTGGDWVTIEPLGIDERLVEDELVEFIAGAGNTSFPIYERVSMEWLQSSLGTVTFGEDGALLADLEAESLLRISYRTKCRKYLVTDTKSEPLQLVAEEAV